MTTPREIIQKLEQETVSPIVDECPICHTKFVNHVGVIGLCEKLTRLIAAADFTVRALQAEFGNTGLEANFKPLLDALDHVRQEGATDDHSQRDY